MMDRHPLDPDPVPSTKAAAVLVLGVMAAATGPLVGGVAPAALALLLARSARAEMRASAGFLTGTRRLRAGTVLAWTGIGLAAVTIVIGLVAGLLSMVTAGSQFDSTGN